MAKQSRQLWKSMILNLYIAILNWVALYLPARVLSNSVISPFIKKWQALHQRSVTSDMWGHRKTLLFFVLLLIARLCLTTGEMHVRLICAIKFYLLTYLHRSSRRLLRTQQLSLLLYWAEVNNLLLISVCLLFGPKKYRLSLLCNSAYPNLSSITTH